VTVDDISAADNARKKNRFHFDRHTPEYRLRFDEITQEMQAKCPMAWTDVYDGHWVAADSKHVFELARCPVVSNDHDINGERKGYQGITIPKAQRATVVRGGILEMDEPEHSLYRGALNPYLSPAAIKRWQPFVDEIVRAALDEKIESGRIDFVDDLANIVPAVLTLAMMGIELKKWPVYSEPAHLSVSTPEHSPDAPRVAEMNRQMGIDMITTMNEVRENPRPGLINALLQLRIDGEPAPDLEILGNLGLIIGGGFDTTTALTAHSLEWLSENPDQRELLSRERATLLNPATEEFLRFYTPAPGDGRTFAEDVKIHGRPTTLDLVGDGQPRSGGVRQAQRADHGPKGQPALQLRHRGASLRRIQRRPHGVQVDADRGAGSDAGLRVRSRGHRALRDHRSHPGHEAPARLLHPGAETRPRS
jgi:cytochrome P450